MLTPPGASACPPPAPSPGCTVPAHPGVPNSTSIAASDSKAASFAGSTVADSAAKTRYIAASTETDEDDAEVEDGCEGPAGAWDAELGASGSSSDGDDGPEFLG